MTLTDWAALGGLVSSAAVVVSLVYLARQIRMSERQTRANMSFGRATRIIDINLAIAQSDIGEMLAKARGAREPLTRSEIIRFYAVCRAQLSNAEDNWLQNHQGLLDDGIFASFTSTFRPFFASPAVRAVWTFMRPSYIGGFRDFIDGLVQDSREMTGRELADLWPDLLATELAQATASHRAV
jgi:hypothetical protein